MEERLFSIIWMWDDDQSGEEKSQVYAGPASVFWTTEEMMMGKEEKKGSEREE